MDLRLGEDMYESFVEYQNRMMAQFDKMVEDYGFRIIDASLSIETVFADLKEQMSDLLANGQAVSAESMERVEQAQNGHATEDVLQAEGVEWNLDRISIHLREPESVE
jgi:hypothetical protein